MRHGSLFSGIGGFDLASQWMGWHNVFQCEIDHFCQRVLKHHFPESILHGNIKETDFTHYKGSIDIVTGGFPCQPFSQAGKRKGTADDRYLWPEMLRAIREIQPLYVVGENVRGLLSWDGGLVFDTVQADLEAEGFECLPFLLPACGVNAPHRRDRIWFIAYTRHAERQKRGVDENGQQFGERRPSRGESSSSGLPESVAHATRDGHGNGLRESGRKKEKEQGAEQRQERPEIFREWNGNHFERVAFKGTAPDSGSEGLQKSTRREQRSIQSKNGTFEGGKSCGILTEMPGWESFPVVSPVRDRNDGLPAGLVRSAIKGLGNAIVPQVAYQIFKALEKVR